MSQTSRNACFSSALVLLAPQTHRSVSTSKAAVSTQNQDVFAQLSTMSQPSRRRQFAPKSKGGCHTCKQRHVRCDQRRPICSPCQTSSRQCEYLDDPNSAPSSQLKIVTWRPPRPMRLSPSPDRTSNDSRALRFFCEHVAASLEGAFPSSFWTYNVPQLAEAESAVFDAVLTLASLVESGQNARRNPNIGTLEASDFVAGKHSRTLQFVQNGKNEKFSSETVLVLHALLATFEMLRGHTQSVISHMLSGIERYHHWRSRHRAGPPSSKSPRPLSDNLATEIQDIYSTMICQTIASIHTTPAYCQVFTPSTIPSLPAVPMTFHSLSEAKASLDGCLAFIFHTAVARLYEESASPDSLARVGPHPAFAPYVLLHRLERWQAAFDALIQAQEASLTGSAEQMAVLLRVQHITGTILTRLGPCTQETACDQFDERFREIVILGHRFIALWSEISPRSGTPPCPSFNAGILAPLYFTASRCRDPTTRHQALELLRRGPQQEGIWQAEMLAQIAACIISLEETACPGARRSEDILGQARISVLNAMIDPEQREVVLHCCRQRSGLGAPLEVLHRTIKY